MKLNLLSCRETEENRQMVVLRALQMSENARICGLPHTYIPRTNNYTKVPLVSLQLLNNAQQVLYNVINNKPRGGSIITQDYELFIF